jgi:hypothetical protein
VPSACQAKIDTCTENSHRGCFFFPHLLPLYAPAPPSGALCRFPLLSRFATLARDAPNLSVLCRDGRNLMENELDGWLTKAEAAQQTRKRPCRPCWLPLVVARYRTTNKLERVFREIRRCTAIQNHHFPSDQSATNYISVAMGFLNTNYQLTPSLKRLAA